MNFKTIYGGYILGIVLPIGAHIFLRATCARGNFENSGFLGNYERFTWPHPWIFGILKLEQLHHEISKISTKMYSKIDWFE